MHACPQLVKHTQVTHLMKLVLSGNNNAVRKLVKRHCIHPICNDSGLLSNHVITVTAVNQQSNSGSSSKSLCACTFFITAPLHTSVILSRSAPTILNVVNCSHQQSELLWSVEQEFSSADVLCQSTDQISERIYPQILDLSTLMLLSNVS